MTSALKTIGDFGQSVWIDALHREFIHSGELLRLIETDGINGLTSNPSIFEKALGGKDYTEAFRELGPQAEDPKAAYERIAIKDIQDAADVFAPLYHNSDRHDGYVSLEVTPDLAHATQGTLDEARRLWHTIGRENVMIKVPGTPEGIIATQQLIGEGINVNITLLFAQKIYEQVAAAYLGGLERLARHGGDLSHVASVASFFISRIDEAVDKAVDAKLQANTSLRTEVILGSLLGKVAISSAKITYQKYLEITGSERWRALSRQGARTQRLLWASTGMKNPNYRDVLYVEELIGKDTVNTLPLATMDAFRDHGKAEDSLTSQIGEAERILHLADQVGIPLSTITDTLLVDGIGKFKDAFAALLRKVTLLRKNAAPV
jgi:transaldolase/glucose-6-phosphate isomerase